MRKRIFLSPPHMSGEEEKLVQNVFKSNWIAPAGPDIESFEKEICSYTGASYAVALSSGTAAIHLALILNGVKENNEVLCSTLTFAGSAFPILYQKAQPVFIDCEKKSWNIDPELLEFAIEDRIKKGKKPAAVIVVHLYGQAANMDEIMRIASRHGILVIEDAAESFGSYHGEKHTGVIGDVGIFSFNGNKIITSSGGGALISNNRELAEKARYLSTQARGPVPYYQHEDVGYNYRLSNVSAAIGRGQLRVIDDRVKRRREIFEYYRESLKDIEEIGFIPCDIYGKSNCWLTCIMLDGRSFTPEQVRLNLESVNVESRQLWKPMHLQPVFQRCAYYGNGVSEKLFDNGLCLPSGSSLTQDDLDFIVGHLKKQFGR
jgi:pyridoxal phosphate-dependent aminotransferase EpsN